VVAASAEFEVYHPTFCDDDDGAFSSSPWWSGIMYNCNYCLFLIRDNDTNYHTRREFHFVNNFVFQKYRQQFSIKTIPHASHWIWQSS
jgi:hypothetical protein